MKLLCFFLASCSVQAILAARILVVFPTSSFSHQLPFRPVMLAMAERGHDVTIITTDPIQNPPKNYRQVNVSDSYDFWTENFDFVSYIKMDPFELWTIFMMSTPPYIQKQFKMLEMKQFLRTLNSSFDLMILEVLHMDAYNSLWLHLGSPPVVGVLTLNPADCLLRSVGSPKNPAYSPELIFPFTDHMSLTERVLNAISMFRMRNFLFTSHKASSEDAMRKLFGPESTLHYDIGRNLSLLLVNSHWKIYYPQPQFPNIIQLAGLTIQTNPEPLSKDLQDFLDGASEGAIYFSLGTNVNVSTISEERRNAFLDAFSVLPQRILLKWELDVLPGKPSNVMIAKWFPQQSVLAHNNTKLFMMQGGLQSLQEAVYYGVPLIGIPFCGDQLQNVGKLVADKMGVKLDFLTATKESILETISNVLHDPTYHSRMSHYSKIFRDELQPSVDRAVWWLEYVLRHPDTPQLYPATRDLEWTQHELLDVLSAFLILFWILMILVFLVLSRLVTVLKTLVSCICQRICRT